jgi:O-antigen/teichoic acid export membrane protein
LVLGFVGFQWLYFASCLFLVGRKIHLGTFFSGSARGKFREFAHFAFPQTLNLTLNRYNSRLDLLMLGHFGTDKALIALYGTVLWLTSELRTIRISVSSAITPIGARLHAREEKAALTGLFNQASRWTTTLVGAALIVVATLLPELLGLLAGKNAGVAQLMDLRFAWVLLLAPFVNCAWGLAGNFMVIAQRQKWTLMNSALTAVMNTLLNLALIPSLGLLGAAIATVFATVSTSSLQLFELSRLEGIRLRWSQIKVPYLALFVVLATLFGLVSLAPPSTLTARLAMTMGALTLYLGALHSLGLPETLRFRGFLNRTLLGRSPHVP